MKGGRQQSQVCTDVYVIYTTRTPSSARYFVTLKYTYANIFMYINLHIFTYMCIYIGKKESQEVVRKAGMVSLCGSEDDIAAAVMLLDADLRGSELFQGINKASGGALFARKGANGQDIKTAPTKPTQATPPPKPQPQANPSQDSYKQPQGNMDIFLHPFLYTLLAA
jgi:hypothetical protein